jgi:hypothetical protein
METVEDNDTLVQKKISPKTAEDKEEIEFIDSTIYRSDKNIYVKITAEANSDLYLVSITLFKKTGNQLIVLQQIDSLESQFGNVIPTFEDFNQDGIKDLNLQFGTGARGGNSYSYVFLQNKETGRLNFIEKSDFNPNLHYDTLRNVITSVSLYSGTTFLDYELKGNKLAAVSGIDVSADDEWTYRKHYTIDKEGKRHFFKKDSVNDKGEGLFSRD